MQELLTQREVEDLMYRGGIARANNSMTRAEEAGRAHQNPYAKETFGEYVLPIAAAITADISVKRAGARQAHVALLAALPADVVAFLAVRTAFSKALSRNGANHRQVAYDIGKTVHRELVLEQIAQALPDLYHTLANDLGRRMSKDERHKVTVMRMQAEKAGLSIQEWPIGSRDQVGMYLLELLETAGLISIGPEVKSGQDTWDRRTVRPVSLQDSVIQRIDQIKGFVSVSMPAYGPCVEEPLPWGKDVVGGYHTDAMRRAHRSLVRARPTARALANATDMPVVYAAANALQSHKWKVNARVLDTVYEVARHFNTKEVVSLADMPAPAKPDWLGEAWASEIPKDEWPDYRIKEFLQWKRATAEWHTAKKLLGVRYGRFYSATRTAEMFRHYPALHFVYFADSRGRFYPLTYGISPQGSDLSKALLHFAEGKGLPTASAVRWFHVQGANKWGFDKATLDDRMAWVKERQDLILGFAQAPLDNRGWLEAGDPFQFLAWCFEYAEYVRSPSTFVSHLPISMDGSCNGLQNLSALLRDEVGGKATNLTNNAVMEDIYNWVAKESFTRLQAYEAQDDAELRIKNLWLAHGVSRKVVKRVVMTTPYGVTERTAVGYIVDDYLAKDLGPAFEKKEYRAAAVLLMSCVWPAIGSVVVKGREAMDWLRKSARTIINNIPEGEEPVIWWTSPSGFAACQDYFEAEVHRIRSRLHGPVKIRVMSETEEPDKGKHASGLAPNFVHSLDAAHLHLTVAAAAAAGITSLAMIHDDYGTHAADADALYEIIRVQFCAMYTACDPAELLRRKYPAIQPPPCKGSLDIMEVLDSVYFFS